MYGLLKEMGIAVVSIGHRPSLLKYHDTLLRLSSLTEETKGKPNWSVEKIEQERRDRIVAQVL